MKIVALEGPIIKFNEDPSGEKMQEINLKLIIRLRFIMKNIGVIMLLWIFLI